MTKYNRNNQRIGVHKSAQKPKKSTCFKVAMVLIIIIVLAALIGGIIGLKIYLRQKGEEQLKEFLKKCESSKDKKKDGKAKDAKQSHKGTTYRPVHYLQEDDILKVRDIKKFSRQVKGSMFTKRYFKKGDRCFIRRITKIIEDGLETANIWIARFDKNPSKQLTEIFEFSLKEFRGIFNVVGHENIILVVE